MNPILDEVAADRDDLRIVKLDVDDNQAVAAQYGVLSMPTFMLFQNGQPIQTLVGSRPRKRLESELEQALVEQPAGR
jgi:thioredoxin 1